MHGFVKDTLIYLKIQYFCTNDFRVAFSRIFMGQMKQPTV